MEKAISLAIHAKENGEIPVGAVIVKDKKIVGVGKNAREQKQNALSHAEIEAINDACKNLGTWRLDGATMYVTLEPCFMCMGAISEARIETLVFGAFDLQKGCADSRMSPKTVLKDSKIKIFGGIMEEECENLLKDFFNSVRNDEKSKTDNT